MLRYLNQVYVLFKTGSSHSINRSLSPNSFFKQLSSRRFKTMMKAIRVDKFSSDSNVLQVQDVEMPAVLESKVLVKVIAAGINPVDVYVREGKYPFLPDLPYIPGKDGAGVVHQIGNGVTHFKVGQRVFILTHAKYGTYAEYCLVDEEEIFPLDDKLTFEEGAAIGVAYFTAYRAVVLKGKCKPRETILIHGASGAVGLASVQLAKNRGLTVFGTAGTKEGMDVVKNCGVDFVFCHKDPNYLEAIMDKTEKAGVNLVIEMLSNVNFDKDLDILAADGRLIIVGSRGPAQIHPRKIMTTELHVTGVALKQSTKAELEETAREILKGIEDGWLKPVVDKKYPLEKASEAQEYIISSPGAKGKLILCVQ